MKGGGLAPMTREGRSYVHGHPKPTPAYISLATDAAMAGQPRAAKGPFPYQHLTCAEW